MDADGLTPGNRKAARAATASALLASALVVVGCTSSKGNAGCIHTAVEVTPVHLAGQSSPVTLQGRLTGDGKPLADFRVAFSLTYSGPTKLVGKAGKVDDLIGYAKTNADGVATYQLRGGPAGEALPGETGVGYTVGITFGNPIEGRYYCGSHAGAPFR
jgi:hypothetical protein